MKTTIDLPDDLLHRAKVVAAQRRTTLKELVQQGLEYVTIHQGPDSDSPRKSPNQALIKALSGVQITEPVGKFNRDEVYDREKGHWE